MNVKGNAVYGQSGGPTSVINASFCGVVSECRKHRETIGTLYAMRHGIRGLIDDDLSDTDQLSEEQLRLLPYTPGAFCGSVRYRLPGDGNDYQKLLATLKKRNIRFIFLNGGNDSMDTCMKLSAFLQQVHYDCRVIGIPKTIDNDLYGSDHAPGYGSAAKFIAATVQSIACDNECYHTGRVNIVEIMGRDTGWLTASASLAGITGRGPDLIYVPEIPFDMTSFLHDVQEVYNRNHRCLVAVSEGIRDASGAFISTETKTDVFRHVQLGGIGRALEEEVGKRLHLPTRAIELSLLQRCFAPLISERDRKEAACCGRRAVSFALKGITDSMVAIRRRNTPEYRIVYQSVPLQKAANTVSYLPREMMNEKGNYVSEAFLSYALPLIGGVPSLPISDGLYQYAKQ